MRQLKNLIAHVAVAFAASAVAAPAVAVALTAPGVMAQARGAELGALESRWEEAVSRREHLVGMMSEVEEEYDVLAGHIARLKREGADGDLRRQRLEALLREARPLAEQLQQMQRAVVQNDEEIVELSEAIVGIMDAKMRRAEREMASASASARARLVNELNVLSARRARYARPLPQLSMRDVNDILESADQVEDPDEMLALADELQDTEASVRQKLVWVQGRLEQLRRRKKLMRRSRTFQRQESFFEEGDRARVVASRVRVDENSSSGDQVDSDEGLRGDGNNDAEPGFNQGVGVPAEPSQPEGGDGLESDAPPPTDGASDPGVIVGGDGDLANDAPVSGGGDDFGGDYGEGGDYGTVVVERQADPSAPARGAYFDDADLDARIDALEGDEASLKKQASELRKRARGLRKRARQLD